MLNIWLSTNQRRGKFFFLLSYDSSTKKTNCYSSSSLLLLKSVSSTLLAPISAICASGGIRIPSIANSPAKDESHKTVRNHMPALPSSLIGTGRFLTGLLITPSIGFWGLFGTRAGAPISGSLSLHSGSAASQDPSILQVSLGTPTKTCRGEVQ